MKNSDVSSSELSGRTWMCAAALILVPVLVEGWGSSTAFSANSTTGDAAKVKWDSSSSWSLKGGGDGGRRQGGCEGGNESLSSSLQGGGDGG